MLSKIERQLFRPDVDRVGLAAATYAREKYDIEHVAILYHCDPDEVKARLMAAGTLRTKSVTRSKYDHSLIWTLHSQGKTTAEICEATGASRNSVVHVVRLGQAREREGLTPVCA